MPGKHWQRTSERCQTCLPKHWRKLTLCGDLRSRFTPAIWLHKGTLVRNVYVGGRVGSGKVVLENGSVSSKYWTLHCKVAMFLYQLMYFFLVYFWQPHHRLDVTTRPGCPQHSTHNFTIIAFSFIDFLIFQCEWKIYNDWTITNLSLLSRNMSLTRILNWSKM